MISASTIGLLQGAPRIPIGRLCSLQNGRAFKPTEWVDAGTPIIRIQNLNDSSKDFNYYSGDLPERFRVRHGDVLLSWSGTPGTSFGCFRWKGPDGWLNQHIFNVRLNPEIIQPDYFVLHVNAILSELIGKAHGGVGLRHITKGQLDKIELSVPSFEVQSRIVDLLSRAENIVRMRREAEQKAKEIIPALFLDMFGDPATNPKGWAQSSLGEVIEQFRYGSSQKSSANGDPVLRIPNVVGGNIDVGNLKFIDASDSDRTRYALARGDILFVRTNGNPDYVGRCAVFEPPTDQRWLYASYLIRGRPVPDAIDPQFLQVQLSSVEGRRRLRERARTAAGQYNINVEGLRSVPIVLPPIDLQCAFSGLVRRAKELAAGSASASAIATASFQSLLSGVFSERRAT